MRRSVAPSDIAATFRLLREVRLTNPDVLHAHGAKGGAYARVIGTLLRASGIRVARIYTPHGGSLHYDGRTASGRLYFAAERGLALVTDALVFVSQYEADAYAAKVGAPRCPVAIARNGLRPEEFDLAMPSPDARDFLFIGALRDLKGPDVFIKALALLRDTHGRSPTALVVGDARLLHLRDGEVPVGPSARAGVDEVERQLPGDEAALAAAMLAATEDPGAARLAAEELRRQIRGSFGVDTMAATATAAYRSALAPAG
jgi:glycosyltransferase involved in cell wall biosynthesis